MNIIQKTKGIKSTEEQGSCCSECATDVKVDSSDCCEVKAVSSCGCSCSCGDNEKESSEGCC